MCCGAAEQARYVMEEKVSKANATNQKGQFALDKVKRQQKRLEGASFKQFKASIAEVEDRKAKSLAHAESIAAQGKRDFLARERAAKERSANNTNQDDQAIVESLYTLEVKLKVGQQRAKNWHDKQVKEKAANFNKRVEDLHDDGNAAGLKAAQEAKEMERLRQVVNKDQKMKEFAKLREDNHNYIK